MFLHRWINKSCCEDGQIKTKKCQPAASDTTDLFQTECVTDRGLACSNKKCEFKIYGKILEGKMNTSCHEKSWMEIEQNLPKEWSISSKLQNKAVKSINSKIRKALNIIHWNMGK